MSSTPSKVPSISSSTPNASKKHSSSSTPGRSEKASNHSSSDSAKKDKKHTSSKSEKEPKRVEEMDADELVDHINGDNDSSISSLDVSEDEAPKAEEKSKKRKREEEASIQYDDEPLTETLLYANLFLSFHPPIGFLKPTVSLKRFTFRNSISVHHFQSLKYHHRTKNKPSPIAKAKLLPLFFNC